MRRLLEWKLTPSQPSIISYEDRLQKLIDYHVKQFPHKAINSFAQVSLDSYDINLLREDTDYVWLEYIETTTTKPGRVKPADTWTTEVSIKYNKKTTEWTFKLTMNDMTMADDTGDSFNKLIDKFAKYGFQIPAKGTKEYDEIMESFIAEDFKIYENLWDN